MGKQSSSQSSTGATGVVPAKDTRQVNAGVVRGTARVCLHAAVPLRRDVRACRVTASLAAAGYEVVAIDMAHAGEPPADLPELGRVRVHHINLPRWTNRFYVPTHLIPWLLFKGWRLAWGIGMVVRTRADVYHASDLAALPACYIAARLRHKPFVYEAYELPLVQPHLVRRRLIAAIGQRFLRHAVRRAAGVIVVTPLQVDEMRLRYGGRTPVVLRNIPPYQPRVESNRLREHLGLPAHARIALYQGAIQPNRGLHQTVLAARHLPPAHYVVLMGNGPSVGELRALIERRALGDRVKLLPAVPYEELLQWTSSADLGLSVLPPDFSPSIKTALPNKLFEYLMAGLPVLASDLPAVGDVLRTYEVGCVVRSIEPVDIARAIAAMLGDGAALARMRENALAAARQELCWEVEQQRLLDMYATLPALRR